MPAPVQHPNAHLITLCSPGRRFVRRAFFVVLFASLFLARGLFGKRSTPFDELPQWLQAIALSDLVVVLLGLMTLAAMTARDRLRFHAATRRRKRHGLIPFVRFWGGSIVDTLPVELEHTVLGSPEHRRFDIVATLPATEDGRRMYAFEVAVAPQSIFDYGAPLHMSCIAVELDPTWVRDVSNLTVSPSSVPFIKGRRDIKDRRWELMDLDARFQFDAGVSTANTSQALAQLFGPQMQVALGTTFCAYWQQRGRWLVLWIPEYRTKFTSWQALWNDALWLRSRYAELGRSAARDWSQSQRAA